MILFFLGLCSCFTFTLICVSWVEVEDQTSENVVNRIGLPYRRINSALQLKCLSLYVKVISTKSREDFE